MLLLCFVFGHISYIVLKHFPLAFTKRFIEKANLTSNKHCDIGSASQNER